MVRAHCEKAAFLLGFGIVAHTAGQEGWSAAGIWGFLKNGSIGKNVEMLTFPTKGEF